MRSARPQGPGRPNLLLVSIDCMRRDRLSAYGHERQTTPFLDSMVERSLHCTSAHSASAWTCPSVVSLLTGLTPHHHGGGLVPGEPKNLSKHNLPTRLSADVPALPDVLSREGYAVGAIGAVWNAHLSIPGRFPQMQMVEKPADVLVKRTLRWIDRQDGPFFLWLHLGDPHEPLDVARDLRDVFGWIPKLPKVRRWDFQERTADVGSPAFEAYRDARVRTYDAAVRSADAALSRLWDGLRSRGAADRTVVAVTADHGEEFWEHREAELASFADPRELFGVGHGHNLFQVHLLVPLVMWGPGISARSIDHNISLIDAAPTLLQALDVVGPEMDGRSLLETGPERPVVSQGIAYGYEKQSVVLGDRKLLVSPGDGYERLFALGHDRREIGELDDPAGIRELRSHLPGGESAMGVQIEATEEIADHLRDLGYIE